jgi:hypothetical protein
MNCRKLGMGGLGVEVDAIAASDSSFSEPCAAETALVSEEAVISRSGRYIEARGVASRSSTERSSIRFRGRSVLSGFLELEGKLLFSSLSWSKATKYEDDRGCGCSKGVSKRWTRLRSGLIGGVTGSSVNLPPDDVGLAGEKIEGALEVLSVTLALSVMVEPSSLINSVPSPFGF